METIVHAHQKKKLKHTDINEMVTTAIVHGVREVGILTFN